MIIMLRSVALLSLICHISLCASSHAGIFKDEESLSDSQRKAEILKEQILPGKIVLSTLDNSSWPDFMSATPIGKPGDSQTKSILSSAHNLLSWQEDGYWQKRNKNYKVYFCDSWGREYKITDAISLSNDRMDAKNDVALYFLEDDIPCSPHNIIERELSSEPNLASLAYGWELVSSNAAYSVCNLFGEKPYYLQNTPYLNTKGLYAHTYETDRMLHLSNEEGQHRYTYLARQNSESSQDFQFYTQIIGHLYEQRPLMGSCIFHVQNK